MSKADPTVDVALQAALAAQAALYQGIQRDRDEPHVHGLGDEIENRPTGQTWLPETMRPGPEHARGFVQDLGIVRREQARQRGPEPAGISDRRREQQIPEVSEEEYKAGEQPPVIQPVEDERRTFSRSEIQDMETYLSRQSIYTQVREIIDEIESALSISRPANFSVVDKRKKGDIAAIREHVQKIIDELKRTGHTPTLQFRRKRITLSNEIAIDILTKYLDILVLIQKSKIRKVSSKGESKVAEQRSDQNIESKENNIRDELLQAIRTQFQEVQQTMGLQIQQQIQPISDQLEEIELQVTETLKRSLSDEDRERERELDRTMIVQEVKKISRGRRIEEEKDYDPVHRWASSFDDLLRDIEDSTLLSGHWSARVIKLLRKVMRYVTNKKTYAAIKRLIQRVTPIFAQMSVSIRTRFKQLMEKRVVPEEGYQELEQFDISPEEVQQREVPPSYIDSLKSWLAEMGTRARSRSRRNVSPAIPLRQADEQITFIQPLSTQRRQSLLDRRHRQQIESLDQEYEQQNPRLRVYRQVLTDYLREHNRKALGILIASGLIGVLVLGFYEWHIMKQDTDTGTVQEPDRVIEKQGQLYKFDPDEVVPDHCRREIYKDDKGVFRSRVICKLNGKETIYYDK